MKKIAIKLIEAFVLFLVLGYLSTSSVSVFFKSIQLLPVEFITYKPMEVFILIKTAFWSSVVITILAVGLEWKREKRKVSYLIYLTYLTAPFLAVLILFLITADMVSSIEPHLLEFMENRIPTEEIPMRLIFIGYTIFPIVHFTLNQIKGRSSQHTQALSRSALQG